MNATTNKNAPQCITTAGPRTANVGSVQIPKHSASVRRGRKKLAADKRIDFAAINAAADARLPDMVIRWLPDGKRCGQEWVARNPRRDDRHAGSFSVNMHSGKWADFASGDKGGDVISLAAFLFNLRQGEAAREIAKMVGIEVPLG